VIKGGIDKKFPRVEIAIEVVEEQTHNAKE
jgi:hypothetical protein